MAARSSRPAKPSLDSVVVWYRREALRASTSAAAASPELEVRLQDVDYDSFATVYAALVRAQDRSGAPVPVGAGELTQVVSAITVLPTGDEAARASRPMKIREIYFEGGKRARERFVRKEPLLIPYRVPAGAGLGYIVALSAESLEARGFSSDETTIIRVKARVSFPLRLRGSADPARDAPLLWRVDLTVARQLMGADADSALPQVVGQMFRGSPPMRADNLLESLGLPGDAAKQALYRYEIEAEFLGPPEARDLVRPADVTAAAGAVLGLVDPANVREAALQAVIYRVASHLVRAPAYLERFRHELGLKRLLPQVQALTRTEYRTLYPPTGFYVTDKAEGVRAVAAVLSGSGVIAGATLLDGFRPDPSADPAAVTGTKAGDTILDGELVAVEGGPVFYAFDVIAVAGEKVVLLGFEARQARLAEGVAILLAAGVPAAAKRFTHLVSGAPADLDKAFRGILEAPRPYPTDGLILVEPKKPYDDDTASFKWKGARENTIDFLAKRPPPSALDGRQFRDEPGHRLHFLFVGASSRILAALGLARAARCPGYSELFPAVGAAAGPQAYQPAPFTPSGSPLAYLYQHPDSLEPIDGKIVEMRCAGDCAAAGGGPTVDWEFVRVRADRARELATGQYFGNDIQVAENVWLNYLDPFPLDQLVNGPSLDYFLNEKSPLYRAQTAVISFVKSQRISALKGAEWVVDLGAGRGQDLGRYLAASVGNLIAVDRDRAALGELIRRRYSHARRASSGRRAPDGDSSGPGHARWSGTVVHVLAADVAADHARLPDRFAALGLRAAGADAVVSNLAVHYMLRDLDALRAFVTLVRKVLRPGGVVVLTVLRGDLVHELFRSRAIPAGGTWDVFESPAPAAESARKYSLRRDYSSDALEDTGQQIGVLLPFSRSQYYVEPLVNPAVLSREFAARGFRRTALTCVTDSLEAFAAQNRALAASLTDGDRQYLSLYGELCFVREK